MFELLGQLSIHSIFDPSLHTLSTGIWMVYPIVLPGRSSQGIAYQTGWRAFVKCHLWASQSKVRQPAVLDRPSLRRSLCSAAFIFSSVLTTLPVHVVETHPPSHGDTHCLVCSPQGPAFVSSDHRIFPLVLSESVKWHFGKGSLKSWWFQTSSLTQLLRPQCSWGHSEL